MATYRARPCPNCNYYLGFTVAKPLSKTSEVSVSGFCLNCGYRLPMHAIVRGTKTAPPSSTKRRSHAPGAKNRSDKNSPPHKRGSDSEQKAVGSLPPNRYAIDLRVIGQELEKLQLRNFNLECAGGAYWVWARKESPTPAETSLARGEQGSLIFWKRIGRNDLRQPKTDRVALSSPNSRRYRYEPADIERIDRAGKARRQTGSGITDGHSLSQLLRTLGALVSQRGQRLLCITWHDISIGVVVETPQGRRELDVFRHDNLYDCWVKLYLRRANRVPI